MTPSYAQLPVILVFRSDDDINGGAKESTEGGTDSPDRRLKARDVALEYSNALFAYSMPEM
jgi:hypothetical protein